LELRATIIEEKPAYNTIDCGALIKVARRRWVIEDKLYQRRFSRSWLFLDPVDAFVGVIQLWSEGEMVVKDLLIGVSKDLLDFIISRASLCSI
jgi:hypothetical protein